MTTFHSDASGVPEFPTRAPTNSGPPPLPSSNVSPGLPPLPSQRATVALPPLPPTLPGFPPPLPSRDRPLVPSFPREAAPVEEATATTELVPSNTASQLPAASHTGKVLVAGLVAAAILATGGVYAWQQRSVERARADEAMAARDAAEIQRRQAAAAAASREAMQREQADRERQRLLGELAQAREAALQAQSTPETSPRSPPNLATEAPVDGLDRAKSMLSDGVPAAEVSRRSEILARLAQENGTARNHLDALPVSRIMLKAGIDAIGATAAATRVQSAVLGDANNHNLESTVLAIEAMHRPVHGDRKIARSANDEGRRLMEASRFGDAVDAFTGALAADPADVEVLSSLAYAYLKNGQPLEAQRTAELAVRMAPRRGFSWNQIAIAQAQRGADWMSVRGFVTLYALSENQSTTRDFLNRLATDHTDATVREAARRALLVVPESAPSALTAASKP